MKSSDYVQARALAIIRDATGSIHGARALLEELTDAGCIADAFEKAKQAKAAGQKSGMLAGGDTFGNEL